MQIFFEFRDYIASAPSPGKTKIVLCIRLSPQPRLFGFLFVFESGYINKQVTLLNPEKIGLGLTVIVLVGLNSHKSTIMKEFEEAMRALPEVIQCYLITGQSADYLLKIIVPDLKAYQSFLLGKLTVINGVSNVHSSFILQTICDTTVLPLGHLEKGTLR